MPMFPHHIPIDRFFPADTLFGNYATRRDGAVASILGSFATGSALWAGRLEAHRGPADAAAMTLFTERLVEYNRNLGVSDDIVASLAGLSDGTTRVVITGQQPGVLGGPLLSLYKIETAIALAARIEESSGVRCVPVYWMGADDADFSEIRDLVMLNATHAALVTSLPSGAHEVAQPVGDIGVEWLRSLWDGLEAFVGGFAAAGGVVDTVGTALSASDLGGVTAGIVAALTRGNVAIVDGREPSLRECARGIILDYFDREDDVRAAVDAGGQTLGSAGFHAQLTLGQDSGVFVLEGGRRTKVPAERRARARERFARDITLVSPGVVLRNLVQDVVFDPLAVVLGPAEIAYRAQVKGVYDFLGVDMPVSFPRLFATYVPPEVTAMMMETGEDVETLVTRPAELVKNVYRGQVAAELEAAMLSFEAAFDREIGTFLDAASVHMGEEGAARTRKRVADVRRRLGQATAGVLDSGRMRALERWPLLETLPDMFVRRGGIQERYLTMLTPFLFEGDTAVIAAAARAHVDAALDGRIEHIVYS